MESKKDKGELEQKIKAERKLNEPMEKEIKEYQKVIDQIEAQNKQLVSIASHLYGKIIWKLIYQIV